MSEKEQRILSIAGGVFARYGYARTTMGDVAKAAGMSRPALYLAFPGKEELFSAVIHRMNEDAFQDIHNGLAFLNTLDEKLFLALERWVAQAYDLAYVCPDARDLFDYAHPAMQAVAAQFQVFLADLLREAVSDPPTRATPEELARTLLFAAHGFKAVATDGADLRRMIAIQVSLTVSAPRAPHPEGPLPSA